MTHTGILIVAGGSGTRMGSDTPKQFLPVDGKPLLMYTIERFAAALPEAGVVVVLPDSQIAHWNQLCEQYGLRTGHTIVAGGETRFQSVKNGLSALSACDYIGVHDGVRPIVEKSLVLRVLEAAQDFGAAVPAVPVADSLREVTRCAACEDKSEIIDSKPVDRSRFVAIQTPQFFRRTVLSKAYEQQYKPEFTDDASVVEAAGYTVTLVPGDPANLKVTTPADLTVAEAFLRKNKHQ